MSDLQLIEDLNLIKSNIHHDLFKKDYDQSLETKDALKMVTEPNQLSQGLSNYPQESDYSLFIKESVETSDKFEHTIIRTFLKEMEGSGNLDTLEKDATAFHKSFDIEQKTNLK